MGGVRRQPGLDRRQEHADAPCPGRSRHRRALRPGAGRGGGGPAGSGRPVLRRSHLSRAGSGRPCLGLRPGHPPGLARGGGAGLGAEDRRLGVRPAASLDQTLAALADPHRRRVVELLRERPRRAGELAEALGLNPPALSRHLRTLKAGGLVEEAHPEFDARVRIYSLRPEPMADLKAWLAETERLWVDQLAAFKAHLERPE
ncbi:hypothetical protein BWR60_16765 [Inquilinus limosus]|uniref:HTH arsR-type domain-containing protein n=1 Tax=Inquilinus limosus TaxID=171674 RepID=A0A211ZL36_9PROT|nr:hypothetical protein BWR60_16765 [Inquilinus limosus]